MKFIIDRFEGDYAVIEVDVGVMVDMPRVLLPSDTKEGDVICISVDEEGTSKRKRVICEKVKGLWD